MTRSAWIGILLAGLITGCGQRVEWTELGRQLTPQQDEQSRRAVIARDEMFRRLFVELQGAMKKSGPVGAISVCKASAPAIAAAVGKEHGVKIGRTALKLRNPDNTAPDWAVGYVNGNGGTPVQLAWPDGRFAALLPIHLKQGCLGCHGAEDAIQAPVREALKAQYAEDHATGFKAGDLRGWFWIEVPAP